VALGANSYDRARTPLERVLERPDEEVAPEVKERLRAQADQLQWGKRCSWDHGVEAAPTFQLQDLSFFIEHWSFFI